jgi:hypothetical protein
MHEWMANIAPPPEPKPKQELIDRVWRTAWSEASGEPEGFGRDARWANVCNAPHLSSGDERSAVALWVFTRQLPGRVIAQG